MKKKILRLSALVLIAFACFSTGGCGTTPDSGASSGAQTEASIALNATELNLHSGDEYRLSTDDGVQYYGFESADESVCTVTGNGIVKAKDEGSAVVTVKAGGKTLTCTVNVSGKRGGNDGKPGEDPSGDKEKKKILPSFLGEEITADNLLCRAPDYRLNHVTWGKVAVTDVYAGGAVQREDGSSFAVCTTNGYSYGCVWYDLLLPEEEPSEYFYYEWDIFSSLPYTFERFGAVKNVEVKAGWNKLRFSWAQLAVKDSPYLFTGIGFFPKGGILAIGSLVGKTAEDLDCSVQFAGETVTTEKFTVENGKMEYVSEGDMLDMEGGDLKGLKFTAYGSDARIGYGNLLPEGVNYDYVTWRMYNGTGTALKVKIGSAEKTLPRKKGWCSVKIDWNNLALEKEQCFISFPDGISVANGAFTIGSATARRYANEVEDAPVTFLGRAMSKTTLRGRNPEDTLDAGTLYFTRNFENRIKREDGESFVAVKANATFVCVYFDLLLPDVDPGYDEYVWEVWSESAMTFEAFAGKLNVQLNAGWNQVSLTWSELSSRTFLFTGIGHYASGQTKIAFGSLTGKNR